MNDNYFISGEYFVSNIMTSTSYIDQAMMMSALS